LYIYFFIRSDNISSCHMVMLQRASRISLPFFWGTSRKIKKSIHYINEN